MLSPTPSGRYPVSGAFHLDLFEQPESKEFFVISEREKLGLRLGSGFGNLGVFLLEALNPSGGIHYFLFPGEKRVALGTNFHPDILFG
jgi:hypothetical protein